MTSKILFVDDDAAMRDVVSSVLGRRGFRVVCQDTGEAALATLADQEFDAIVTDLQMQGMDGLEFCRRAMECRPAVPVVVVTGFGSMETAVAAIRAGAYDFVTKPFQMEDIVLTLTRAIQHRQLGEEVKRLRIAVEAIKPGGDIIGDSPPMKEVYALLSRMQQTDATVLITGESGTGKELVARAIHDHGQRRAGPFVAINCAAIPETMIESELFGHMKGAFTDARTSRQGLLLEANGGTLFLDEIGEMPLSMQAKLLRALQERKARPVGGNQEVSFDARIVCATSRDLEADVADHHFREDLFYRINVIRLQLPSLSARGNDVLLVAQHFIERFARHSKKKVLGITRPAAEKLLAYAWPGNVRELSNCMERAVALTSFDHVVVDDLPEQIRTYRSSVLVLPTANPAELIPMAEVEKRYVLKVLEALSGNRTMAARILGFDRRTLYRKLESYGVPALSFCLAYQVGAWRRLRAQPSAPPSWLGYVACGGCRSGGLLRFLRDDRRSWAAFSARKACVVEPPTSGPGIVARVVACLRARPGPPLKRPTH
jgi:two-component system response regulator AtoC